MPGNIKDYEIELSNNPLFQNEIVQLVSIKKDGSVEIPWITPKATSLILSLWKNFNGEKDFPISMIEGNHIYCG